MSIPGTTHPRRTGRTAIVSLVWCVGLVMPWAAAAEPGDHIRFGVAEVIPSLALGFEYRSNIYHEEVDPQGGGNLRVAPAIELSAEGEDHRFALAAEYELRKQLFLSFDEAAIPSSVAGSFDKATALSGLDRYNDFSAEASANLFRKSALGFDLSEEASYRNTVIDSDLTESPYLSTLHNGLEGAARIRPGGALEFKVGGLWRFDDYRVPEFLAFSELDSNEHDPLNTRNVYGPRLAGAWNFFPNTALVVESEYLLVRWKVNEISSLLANPVDGVPGEPVTKPDSEQLRVQAGLRGRITPKIRADLLAGYANSSYGDVDLSGLQRLLFTAQVGYKIQEGSSIALGYRKDFSDVVFTNYMASDYVFLQADTKLGDLGLSARYGLRFENYRGAIVRSDIVNKASFDANYALSDWAKLQAGVFYQARYSDVDLVEYDDVGVGLQANFAY